MSRNAIETVKSIFESLNLKINQDDVHRVILANRRIMKPDRNFEKNFEVLANSNIVSSIKLFASENIFGIKFLDRSFILIPELSDFLNNSIHGLMSNVLLEDEEISYGIKMIALGENLVPIVENDNISLELIEKIFALESSGNAIEYNLEQLEEFFRDFEVWEVDSHFYDIENRNDLYRIYCNYQLTKKEIFYQNVIILNLYPTTIETIKNILESQNSKYISDVVYKAITATHWEHCYLEMYRCIENLYLIHHIDILTQQLSDDAINIAIGLNSIGFRSTERSDVNKLFEKLSTSIDQLKILKDYFDSKNNPEEKLEDEAGKEVSALQEKEIKSIKKNMADKLYQIRCDIAHLKYKHNHPNYTDEEWNLLITTMAMVIRELYDIYGTRLSSILDN